MSKLMGDFNKLADCYDYYHSAHNTFIELLKKEYRENKDTKIVDVGCGTGNETLNIYNKFKCTVYGIDPAKNMLKKAAGKSDKIVWLEGTAERIPVGNNSIDIITSFFSIHHFLDIHQAAIEFKRILKTNSKAFIFTISHSQMKNSLEYQFFPELLKYDINRIPHTKLIKNSFIENGFKIKTKGIEYETRKIDKDYIKMVKNRYRTGFELLTDEQILQGIGKIKKTILNSSGSEIIDKIMCSVLICEKQPN